MCASLSLSFSFPSSFAILSVVPHGTPKEIVDKLNKEINEALKDPGMLKKLGDLGGIPVAGTPADFGKFLAAETAKWEKVVRAANLSIE